jgi:hypothetical protein
VLTTLLLPRVCYEAVPVFLKASQVGFHQPKYSLGFPCVHAPRPQADYEALLPLHHASRFGDVLLNTAKVVFETHMELTQRTSKIGASVPPPEPESVYTGF